MPGTLLSCRALRKAYGDLVAVDDVSFHIAAGETYGLLGPNGAGKTTTISMVVGLQAPDGGEVEVAGQRMTTRACPAKRAVGYVPQELAIYPDLTGRENLRFFARLYGLSGSQAESRIQHVLEVVGLAERAADRAGTYSGGMQRRLNIAIGLLHGPELLVLDEPTVGVDPQSRNAILTAVEELATAGMSVLYTTHYMEEAERLCDRIGIIDEGHLVAEGTRRELVARAGGTETVRLEVAGDAAPLAAAAAALPEVTGVDAEGGGLVCAVRDATVALPRLLAAAADLAVAVTGVEVQGTDLETVFLHLTGKALRDV